MSRDPNQKLLRQLASLECQDTTFPFQAPALVLDQASGTYIWDVEGNRYLDLCAGFGSLPLGHNHPSLLNVFQKFQRKSKKYPVLMGLGDVYSSRVKIEFLHLLKSFLPRSLTKGALGLSGSHAVEIALKTAQLATKKAGFICFDGSYHGLDLGVLPITSRRDFKTPFKKWIREENAISLPLHCDIACILAAIKKQLRQGIGTAGLIIEPIQGRAGVVPADISWLQEIRAITKKQKIPLIFDEVLTGAGRSGRFTFAHEVPCDLLCLGKAIGGGFPLSACFGTEEMMSAWPKSSGEALHTGTFFGHPFCCEVGIVTLQQIRKDKLIARSEQLGKLVFSKLQVLLGGHSLVKDIRGSGLMLAVEFAIPGYGVILMNKLRQKNMIALVSGEKGQCLSITPPLNIGQKVLVDSVYGISRVLRSGD